MSSEHYTEVIGIRMYNRDNTSAAGHVMDTVLQGEPKTNRCISATGAHGIVTAQKDPSFQELLNGFYMNLPDGMPTVWLGRLKGAREMRRCYGPDFFAELMKLTSGKEVRHFLCGGQEGVADKLAEVCRKKFDNDRIAGTFTPPFQPVEEYDYKRIGEMINKSGTDVVWVGISTPKQERFARFLSRHANVHFLITVGAAFDFHIGNVRQAPSWIQKAGLEWFFRLCTEPKRLYRRYFEIVPKFILYSLQDLLGFADRDKPPRQ